MYGSHDSDIDFDSDEDSNLSEELNHNNNANSHTSDNDTRFDYPDLEKVFGETVLTIYHVEKGKN